MKLWLKTYLVILSLLSVKFMASQETFFGGTAHYMYQVLSGDKSQQYGSNSNLGFNLNVKLRNNITLGMEGQFLFGSQYKDLGVLGNMVTSGGFIIGEDNSIETPELEGRGGNFFVEVGKIFPLNNKNKNSGLHIKGGLGYLFYSAYNTADVRSVTQLSGEYFNGYNRLESGLSVNSFLGYTLYSKSKLVNGSIGLQMIYSTTKFQGALDYSTGLVHDQSARSSFFIGPKIGMTVVLKRFMKQDPKSDGYFYN